MDSVRQRSCHQNSVLRGSTGHRQREISSFWFPSSPRGSSAEVFCQNGPTFSSRLAAMLQGGRVGLKVPPVPVLSWHFRSYESPKGARHSCVAGVLRVPVARCWTFHRATGKSQTSPRKSSLSIHGLVRIQENKPRKKRINRQMGGKNGNKTKIKKKSGLLTRVLT